MGAQEWEKGKKVWKEGREGQRKNEEKMKEGRERKREKNKKTYLGENHYLGEKQSEWIQGKYRIQIQFLDVKTTRCEMKRKNKKTNIL